MGGFSNETPNNEPAKLIMSVAWFNKFLQLLFMLEPLLTPHKNGEHITELITFLVWVTIAVFLSLSENYETIY